MLFAIFSIVGFVRNSDWIFLSDFLTYREISDVLYNTSLLTFMEKNVFSVRPTEPLFSFLYWIFAPHSYVLLPLLAVIFYLRWIFANLKVTWLAITALFLLLATTLFQAFHLQRQFLATVFLLYGISSKKRFYQVILFVSSVLIHNSSVLFFPLFLSVKLSAPLIIGLIFAVINISIFNIAVGGDYILGTQYYFILALFLFIVLFKRSSQSKFKWQICIMILFQFAVLSISPYLGSRLYFTFFFVLIIPFLITNFFTRGQYENSSCS